MNISKVASHANLATTLGTTDDRAHKVVAVLENLVVP